MLFLICIFIGIHLIDRSQSSCFHLIGLDITVSCDGHMWFLETNNDIMLRSFGWMMDYNYNLVVSFKVTSFFITLFTLYNYNRFLLSSKLFLVL